MYFKRLEMHGFKSFADPVVIDFHEGITCIVGPNGSGKSNICDAIRWVLGEQSPRTLRGGKMEEVIFSGTASRKSRGMAEVTLVIDNSAGILDTDYSEVAITRRMYRSGESEYLINNNPCRLRDIRELITDTGIGVDGYSIIGQGKIADIVSNRPESRREIFEEAAGVVMYKSRRQDAERRLLTTQANLDRVQDLIAEIEGRIDGLREDSIKAREYLELRGRYENLEVNIILKRIDDLRKADEAFDAEMKEYSTEIDRIRTALAGHGKEREALVRRREEVEKQAEQCRIASLELGEEIHRAVNRDQVGQERLRGIDNEQELINKDILNLSRNLEKSLSESETLKKTGADLGKALRGATADLDRAVTGFNDAVDAQSRAAAEVDEARSRLFELSSEKRALEADIKGTDGIVENLQKRRLKVEELSRALRGRDSGDRTALSEAASHKREKEDELRAGESERIGLSDKSRRLEADIRELSAAISRARVESGRLGARLGAIEEMQANYEGYASGVRAVMKAGLPGLEGVVAELMQVPRGYETAIETALGAGIQNIICRDDESAKRAVAYLKEHRAGRLTFLPVSSLRHTGPSGRPAAGSAGYLGMADSIISFDARYKDIYSYLLGRTAIVKSMDDAVRISRSVKGLRCVTLDGDVVNPYGAITGGAYRNKSADILERRAETADLKAEIKKIDSAIEEKLHGMKLLTEKKSACDGRIKDMGSGLEALRTEIAALQAELSGAETRVRANAQEAARYQKEIADIDEQVRTARSMTGSQQAGIESIAGRIGDIEAGMEALDLALDRAKAKSAEASELVTAARVRRSEAETRIEAHAGLSEKARGAVQSLTKQIEEKKESLRRLAAEREELLAPAESGFDIEAKTAEKAALDESYAALVKDRDEIRMSLETIEDDQKEMGDQINKNRDLRYQLELRKTRGETQIESYKEKLFDEFEISYAQAADRRSEDFVFSRAVREVREIRERVRELGDVNVGAIEEYDKVSERYRFMTENRDDIARARDELTEIIARMDTAIKTRFKDTFDRIVVNFESIFRELFGGGQAELRLENAEDPLSSGVEIIAQPPGKKLQNIDLMSGGEKTMTAIALMFAVLKVKPTPFCILDEVEAALDDNNIDRFANYLKNFRDIQFALVTHQKATMEHADVLYGVTMPEHGISKLLSLRLGDDIDLG